MNPALQRALADQGYAEPTAVQAAVLEAGAGDRDMLVSAQTGSGKTVAYGLAAAESLMGERPSFGPVGPPLALIIAPTRELAMQVERELTWLYAHTGARVVSCVGGMDPRREQRALAAGCHVVVGTPGRLKDHLERGNLDVSALSVVILDEADEMLDLGFREDLEFILDAAPAERRTLLFSATIAREIAQLAKKFQNNAVRIDTVDRSEPHGDIEYRAIRAAPNDIEHAVVNLLRYFESPGVLVFCSTREAVKRLHGSLIERGFAAVALSGELSQSERTHALQSLRDGRSRVCVATDVAARGLDLPDLGLVIHADLPSAPAGLLHRSGRTGRAGKKGISVVLVRFTQRRKAEMLFRGAGVEPTWGAAPTAEEIRLRDQERFLADPIFTEAPSEEEAALVGKLLSSQSAEQVATALIRLHRKGLPSPEELFDVPFREVERAERGERVPRSDRQDYVRGTEGASWFRLTIGRNKNADPKWLIPLICRLGHVTKKDIGAIKIFERETKFEIIAESAERFAAQVQDATEKDARIEPAGGPPTGESAPPRKSYGKPAFEPALEDAAPRKAYGKPSGPPGDSPPRKPYGKPGGPGGKFNKFAKNKDRGEYQGRKGPPPSGGDGPPKRLPKRD
jgi:ATP-dependent RNA helicase DeaD